MREIAIDVLPSELDCVKAILRTHVPDRTVLAFGSRTRGKAKPFSDLDLAILGDQPIPVSTHAALQDAFEESALPFKVDIVDWATTEDSFRSIILQEAVHLLP